jgi:hypothetical protein
MDATELPIGYVWAVACQCLRCGHQWLPRKANIRPKACGKCKNFYWDRPRQPEANEAPSESPKQKTAPAKSNAKRVAGKKGKA